MESEPEFLAKTQRSQAAKKRREPNLEFLRLGSFASLREKSCSKNKKLRTCITDTTNIWFGASCHEKEGDYDKLSSCHATTLQLPCAGRQAIAMVRGHQRVQRRERKRIDGRRSDRSGRGTRVLKLLS